MAKIINGSSLALALANYLCTNAYLNDTAQDVLIMVGNWIDEAQEITVPKWIPVSERLPEHSEIVLCRLTFNELRVLQWDRVSKWWLGYGAGDDWRQKDVTHWMPLPEPPKEEPNVQT